MNVVVVRPDGVLRTPPFDRVLRGTTVRRVLELATQLAPPHGNAISAISQVEMTVAELRSAAEIFLCAGDTHVYAITSLDGKRIGEGKPGPVTKAMIDLLAADVKGQFGDANHTSLDARDEGVLV